MSAALHNSRWPWLAGLVLAGGVADASAQARYARVEEPQWFKLRINEVSVGAYAEGTYENSNYRDSSVSATYNRLFVGPLLGINLDGSVYHPNLFRFRIDSEGAYGWGQENTSSTTTVHRNEMEYLGRFNGSADILAGKSYNASVYGNYDHTFRDYDFFSQVTVDTWRYGARASYVEGPLSIIASYMHRDEEDHGLNVNSVWHEDLVSLTARHDRDRGGTSLNYTLDQYSRLDFNVPGDGVDQTVSFGDSERFGSRDQFRLNSNAAYTHRDTSAETSDQITAGLNLVAEHQDNLKSFYDFTYDHYEAGPFSSDNLTGQAQLQHQLYESLTSTPIIRASDYEASDLLSSGYTRRYGAGFAESYVKQLSTTARLRLNNTFFVDHVDTKGISTVENEAHSFNGGQGGAPPGSFFLNVPNVFEPSIQVWNVGRTRLYIAGFHYQVFRNGSLTQIQRVLGTDIDDNVVVDYRAEPSGEGSYEALSETFQIRFDLFNNLWGLYGRLNLFLNNAPKELRVQNLKSYTVGTDFTWRWLRLGAEYELYDSDLSQYRTARLFQGFSFHLDEVSTLGLNFTESWTDYLDADREEQDFRFITIYNRSLSHRWRVTLEGGVHLRRGPGVDQTLATARPGLEYIIGKTSFKVGYEFEYELFLDTQERDRQQFFCRLKRVF
jgi:hypothetical protein